MKSSVSPHIGDLVVALYDEERGISCAGLVMEATKNECRVLWSSETTPIGWFARAQLKVISAS